MKVGTSSMKQKKTWNLHRPMQKHLPLTTRMTRVKARIDGASFKPKELPVRFAFLKIRRGLKFSRIKTMRYLSH